MDDDRILLYLLRQDLVRLPMDLDLEKVVGRVLALIERHEDRSHR